MCDLSSLLCSDFESMFFLQWPKLVYFKNNISIDKQFSCAFVREWSFESGNIKLRSTRYLRYRRVLTLRCHNHRNISCFNHFLHGRKTPPTPLHRAYKTASNNNCSIYTRRRVLPIVPAYEVCVCKWGGAP